jgi:hypothetical protein
VNFGALGGSTRYCEGGEVEVVLLRWRFSRKYSWLVRKSGETMSIMASL